jgi:hypothetical protein
LPGEHHRASRPVPQLYDDIKASGDLADVAVQQEIGAGPISRRGRPFEPGREGSGEQHVGERFAAGGGKVAALAIAARSEWRQRYGRRLRRRRGHAVAPNDEPECKR